MSFDNLKIERNRRARRIALRLDVKERVMRLVLPMRASMKAGLEFAEQHEAWIAQKLAELPEERFVTDGSEFIFLGEGLTLRVHYDTALKSTRFIKENGELKVFTNQENISLRLTRHLKREAEKYFMVRLQEKAARIGKKIAHLSIRDTKSRWGSAGPDGKVSLNWRLAFAPFEAFDYVVAHEAAHLLHPDHSRAFWRTCMELSENYRDGHRWMKQHGEKLMAYRF
ncbi:MAG: DUF45 domain-containing protein [Alphaproteobacteria bacterium]|nr:DUF45 domain-containing protein [Alphaproteobacteria bacterium]